MSEKERQTLAAIIRFFYLSKDISSITGICWKWHWDRTAKTWKVELKFFDNKTRKERYLYPTEYGLPIAELQNANLVSIRNVINYLSDTDFHVTISTLEASIFRP